MSQDQQVDVIVVGAGVVGSALAFVLGKQGRNVVVLERDLSEPDRIVGELLQPGGVIKLKEMGLEDTIEGIDAPDCFGYGVFIDGKSVHLPYPKTHKGLAVKGKSFHHGRFIMKLREAAQSLKNVELRQGIATSLIEEGAQTNGVYFKKTLNSESEELRAPLTIVCDGCFSNLRKKFANDKPVATSSFLGVILNDCTLPFPNHGHVFLTNSGPILAYQIGTRETRMLVDIPHPLPSSSNGDLHKYLLTITAPQLPGSVRSYFEAAVNEQKPRTMPNSRLHPQEGLKSGVMLLGDSFNMRHPLTGGGMTVGLSDAALVCDLLKDVPNLHDQQNVVNQLQTFYEKRKSYASTINILAGALYNVFTPSEDPLLPEMRKGCFKYFEMGGICQSGPISLLSGLNGSPMTLIMHFFAVAFFGVARMLFPFPTPRRIFNSYKLLAAAANIVVPLIKGEHVLPFVPLICRFLFLTKKKQAEKSRVENTNVNVNVD